MFLLAGAVLVAAIAGLARRWGSGPTPEGVARQFTVGTIAAMVAGALAVAVGDRIGGDTGLAVLDSGLALIAVGAAAAARIRAGFVLIAVGVAANLAVIAMDGGMPVRGVPAAVQAAGHHHGVSSQDHLVALSDGIAIGAGMFSPGDLAVGIGAAVAVFAGVPRRRPRTAGPFRAAAGS
jgi:hypothetical protein